MEENKNLNSENETEAVEETTNNEVSEAVAEEIVKPVVKEKKVKKEKKERVKKLKNQFLLKKGSYSVAITALVIAGIILLNVLVSALANRVVLDYDFSTEKKNSLSQENIDYIKKVDTDVSVTFCGDEETYSDYMSYYAQNSYNISTDATEYFNQTLKIVNKYAEYNKKIKLSFVDTQSSEFSKVSSQYSGESITYGDIIVSAQKGEVEKHKVIGFNDIYTTEEDSTYASMGYTTANVTGNDIENALTRAISYVVSEKASKVAMITGHTKSDAASTYKQLLEDNNYEVTEISDKVLAKLSNEFDGVVIAAPSTDFIGSEIKVLSDFLDNDAKLGKGLICFTDVTAGYLKNFYSFLEEWGVEVEDGILYETDDNYHAAEDPTTLVSGPMSEDDLTTDMNMCITGYNVPLTAAFESQDSRKVTTLISTPQTTIAVPKGTGADFKDAGKYEGKSYSTCIQSTQTTYVDGTKEANSYVTVFSSVDFINSEYNEYASISNKNITLKVAERNCGTTNSDISFVTKSITDESFADSVTEASSNIVRVIFMFLIPIITIIAGIIVFVKRRNA